MLAAWFSHRAQRELSETTRVVVRIDVQPARGTGGRWLRRPMYLKSDHGHRQGDGAIPCEPSVSIYIHHRPFPRGLDSRSSQRTGIHARVRAGWVGAALFRCVCGTRRHVTGKRTRPGDGSAHCRAVVYLVVRRDLHDGEHGAVKKCVLNPSSRCLSAPLVPQRDLVHAPLT